MAKLHFLRNKYGVKTDKIKNIKVTMSMAPHIHEYATAAADEQGTTFSGLVSRLIVEEMRSTPSGYNMVRAPQKACAVKSINRSPQVPASGEIELAKKIARASEELAKDVAKISNQQRRGR